MQAIAYTDDIGFKQIKRTLTFTQQVENMNSDLEMECEDLIVIRKSNPNWHEQIKNAINQNVKRILENYKGSDGFSGKVEDLLGLEGTQAQQIWKLELDSIKELKGKSNL